MEKETEEIKKIIAERKSIIVRQYIDLTKGILIVIGAIVIFLVIQKPESILNHRTSQEEISRERAKLILDLFNKNDDPDKIILGLSIIKYSYPRDDVYWMNGIENILYTRMKYSKVTALQNLPYYTPNIKDIKKIASELESLLFSKSQLQILLISEISGELRKTINGTSSGYPGYGPRAFGIESLIEENDNKISFKIDSLKHYGIELNLDNIEQNISARLSD